ncbi:MAG: hypothetical protein ABSD29_17250 [Verrucomicrobiota bacterium]|jgi:hypothetical protein
MPSEPKGPEEQHRGIWRFPPARLFLLVCLWADKHKSLTLTKIVATVVGGLILAAILAVIALAWKQIVSWIPFLGSILAALQTEALLELWRLLVCIAVPLGGVLVYVWLRLRRPIIHSAQYGANPRFNDVRRKVEKEVRRGRRRIPAENLFFGEGDPQYDPCRDVLKSLTIDYCIRGHREIKTVQEHGFIDLD